MKAKYYLVIRPQTNYNHIVHSSNCPFLPEGEKRIFLGSFQSHQNALEESRKYFRRSFLCPFCLNEHLVQKDAKNKSMATVSKNLMKSGKLVIPWESAFLCSLN